MAITLIDQIEVYPAKRVGKHWVPITDRTKKKITFGLRRLYKNTYLKVSKKKKKKEEEEENAGSKSIDSVDNYDLYELFTFLVILSLLVYGILQTEFFGGQLRKARVPLTILLAIPGLLLLAYMVIEAFYKSVNYEEFSDSEGEDEADE